MKIIKETDTKYGAVGFEGTIFDIYLDEVLPIGTVITHNLMFGRRLIIVGHNQARFREFNLNYVGEELFQIGREYFIVDEEGFTDEQLESIENMKNYNL